MEVFRLLWDYYFQVAMVLSCYGIKIINNIFLVSMEKKLNIIIK